ncbi:xanthine dehydrogenase accessory protein XdhC [Pseudoalteromonas sp. SWXJZ94C]|uniref:xanthine dehydrogenase accessory protein XdhC n=1 Tax=Pseudoalteromonas sp. SWXJZ94C TaxID=2792065 RepID=UPI0018CF5C9C|nr:xanthine dehydrogenase accessory protein XdhC [Pseudoalteromonas sp. SWXJZ94C]MBH0058903.1 xanthine dehydrogenase accessory protein XdhC [Pseudoalteromonas sp. SWXJZ94C]
MTNLNQSFQGFHTQNWAQAIAQHEQSGTNYVIATVLGTNGSTPRGTGSKMVISGEHIYDTLGGGHLEFVVIKKARELLVQGEATQVIEQFNLAANLGQCCGGVATVMLECMQCERFTLDIYGAGHVAQALIGILAQLPIRIRWIDNRADVFPEQIPANVVKIIDEEPTQQIKHAPNNNNYLILTHNHQLDFELTQAIIKRGDANWLGVIGSDTKAKRFKQRLTHRNFTAEQVKQMICPVGLKNVTGKLPMEVAISISAQLISLYQAEQTTAPKRQGLQWRTLKNALISSAQTSLNGATQS